MSYRRTRAIFQKELRHILRDVRSLILALALPALMLLLFGFALSLDVDRIPTLIYDADRSPQSRDLIQRLQGSRYFEIRGFVDNYAAIERQIDRGEILMGVAFAPRYGKRILAGQQANVQVLLDGSDSNTASIALGYMEALVRAEALQLRRAAQSQRAGLDLTVPVTPELRVWYNNSLQSKNYVVPGLIAVILMIIGGLLTSLTIAREWEMGTMEQLLSTPLRPAEIVLGKMLAFFLVGAADTAVSVLVGVFVFHVPFRGSFLILAFTSSVFLAGVFFWGIFLSAATRSQLLAYQLGLFTSFLPSFLLSGFIYSIESMPGAIQVLTHIVPARYFVTILKGVFLKGVGLEVLWVDTLFLIAFAGLVFLATTAILRKKMA